MISKDDVFDLLLKACPSFEQNWKEHLLESYEPGDEPLLYIDLGEFARPLVKLAIDGKTSEFSEIFDIVEKLHVDGDDFVREAATIGLLEDIQNPSEHNKLDPEFIYNYLRPQ